MAEVDLDRVFAYLHSTLSIATHKSLLRNFYNTFTGADAVQALIRGG
jgi:hypothetical protein